jgi:diguanylate cyclase
MTQSSRRLDAIKSAAQKCVLMSVIFAANSLLVIEASKYANGMAALWSANAILLFLAYAKPFSQTWPYYIGSFIGGVIANTAGGYPPALVMSFSVANILEVWLGVWIFARIQQSGISHASPANMVRAVVAISISTALAACLAITGADDNWASAWRAWFLSDLLGYLIIVPCLQVIAAAVKTQRRRGFKAATAIKHGLVYGLVAAVSAAVFLLNEHPLLFTLALPVLMAIFVTGSMGAVISTTIIAAIAVPSTMLGIGPVAASETNGIERIWLLQFFLASQLMISLPVAALLDQRRRDARLLLRQEQELRANAEAARRQAEGARRKLAIASNSDELTGLATRARVLRRLNRFLASDGQVMAVAIFDIDHFKSVNDRLGHLAGDAVLASMGLIVRETMPRRFALGRIGGEEFLILMPGVDGELAQDYCEQLRVAIMLRSAHECPCPITVSIGLTEARPGTSVKDIMTAADHALYSAKESGRNQIKLAA